MAFGVVALMLYVAGFPLFLLFFVGVLTFFIWKVFSSEGRNETRRIFEFYLTANEILRDDERRWYGFEIQEAVHQGEAITRSMTAAPPLVYFALGSLYQLLGDHASAEKNLARVVDDVSTEESSIVYPSRELREYVRMLRKIERSPAEAPLTSKAVRSLERARKNRAKDLLDQSRIELAKPVPQLPQPEQPRDSVVGIHDRPEPETEFEQAAPPPAPAESVTAPERRFRPFQSVSRKKRRDPSPTERQTISEVLHDIYDKNA